MKAYRVIAVFTALVFLLTACYLPGYGTAPAPEDNGAGQDDTSADNGLEETQMALALAQTMTAMAPVVPPATDTPANTPTPQPTVTPSTPTLTVTTATNCRTGPGQAYPIVGSVNPGQTAEIVGRYSGEYWVVREPASATPICWVWNQYATVTGNVSALPYFDAPPTPTATVTFNVSYNGLATCGGLFAFRFLITNNGSLTWESIRINITDNTTAATFTHQLDAFRDYPGCVLGDLNQDLMPGESGGVANVSPGHLAYDPTGHSITATLTLCSANGMGGTCVSKTLSFTP